MEASRSQSSVINRATTHIYNDSFSDRRLTSGCTFRYGSRPVVREKRRCHSFHMLAVEGWCGSCRRLHIPSAVWLDFYAAVLIRALLLVWQPLHSQLLW